MPPFIYPLAGLNYVLQESELLRIYPFAGSNHVLAIGEPLSILMARFRPTLSQNNLLISLNTSPEEPAIARMMKITRNMPTMISPGNRYERA